MGAYDGTRPLACHRIQGIIGALPLRVRYFSRRECPRGTWFSVMPCRTFCCRIDATILHLHYRSLPRLLASLLTSCRPQVGALPTALCIEWRKRFLEARLLGSAHWLHLHAFP